MTAESKKAYMQAYYPTWKARNLAKLRAYKKQYNFERREKRRLEAAQWRRDNPEAYKAQLRSWYARNKERWKAQVKAWGKANPEKIYAAHRAWFLKNSKDPYFRLVAALRTRVQQALRGKCKSARTLELLGCPVEAFREHLQNMFKRGMSWENYGLWHVDHVRPCDSFDLSDPVQQRQCFNFLNLQPLWATENLSKGNKYAAA